MTLDEWCAEQCGTEVFRTAPDGCLLWTMPNGCIKQWTLQDARCREIVREHFRVDTNRYGIDWESRGEYPSMAMYKGIGKTIAEAEINCIQAIMEAS